jgi:hypothetical protein
MMRIRIRNLFDPGSRIRDGKFGSGNRYKNFGFATLATLVRAINMEIPRINCMAPDLSYDIFYTCTFTRHQKSHTNGN